jgi:hypothetical protein
MDTIEAGKFVNPAMVDAYAYINDYIFPYAIDANEDLSIFVKLEEVIISCSVRNIHDGDNVKIIIWEFEPITE